MEEIVTINCFFFLSVWRSLTEVGGGLPLLHTQLFHSFCLSHFSINLHGLASSQALLGVCSAEQIKCSFSPCLAPISPSLLPFPAAAPLGGGVPAQDAELRGASQALAAGRLHVSD